MRSHLRHALIWLWLAGCDDEPSAELDAATPMADAAPAPREVSYQRDIRPAIETHCLPCHASGGIAPLALDSWPSVERVKRAVTDAVASGAMPPYPATPACRDYERDHVDRELFASWSQQGFPEGDARDYIAPTRDKRELGPPDLSYQNEPYTPPANTDEYRCFLLDEISEGYVRALRIAPGQPNEVHHAQLHRIARELRSQVEQLDTANAGLGYPCPNGPGVESELLYSYRPGTDAVAFAAGDAAFVADSTLLLQVHYNTEFAPPSPDRTTASLWLTQEPPARVLVRTGATASIAIPAGAPYSAISNSPMRMIAAFNSFHGFGGTFIPGEIVGIAPHAHQLATRMHAKVTGSEETCLVDVPRWDFHLQLDYLFTQGVPFAEQDRLEIRCEYDNSADNQPVINGVQNPPRDITWGEKSSDEMCLFYLWLRFDRAAFEQLRRE